jgi:3-hydroxyisobutyrate dehydrogenase-like beta-hydroxyacid dehydrogenase
MKIAFLGLGNMGAPMAKRLLEAGHELTVWNRTPARAESLAVKGAKIAATPAKAAFGADLAITMLFDDAAHEAVLFGADGLLAALEPGATLPDSAQPETAWPATAHMAMSTISVALSERLTEEHKRRGIPFVAAPVFGRPNVAEAGKLWIVLAGAAEALERVKPAIEPIARGFTVVGAEPAQAHAVKLGGNFLISAMIHSLSEGFVYAESQGIQPAVFFEAINSALFQSPFYAAYANVMLNPPKEAGAPMTVGLKDLTLFREAAASRGVRLSLAEEMADVFAEAVREGLGSEDWAVGQYRMAQRRSSAH